MDLRNEHTEAFVSRNILSSLAIGRRSMHQTDYLPCTKIWGSAAGQAPYNVLFTHRGRFKFCAVRGKTKSTYFKAVTRPWFV